MYEDEEYGFCPECGALMKNGVCISCGYDRNKKDAKAEGCLLYTSYAFFLGIADKAAGVDYRSLRFRLVIRKGMPLFGQHPKHHLGDEETED